MIILKAALVKISSLATTATIPSMVAPAMIIFWAEMAATPSTAAKARISSKEAAGRISCTVKIRMTTSAAAMTDYTVKAEMTPFTEEEATTSCMVTKMMIFCPEEEAETRCTAVPAMTHISSTALMITEKS